MPRTPRPDTCFFDFDDLEEISQERAGGGEEGEQAGQPCFAGADAGLRRQRRTQEQASRQREWQEEEADAQERRRCEAPEQWAAIRMQQLRTELRSLAGCERRARRAKLRALQLELHPDKQPAALRAHVQPLFLLVQREWEAGGAPPQAPATPWPTRRGPRQQDEEGEEDGLEGEACHVSNQGDRGGAPARPTEAPRKPRDPRCREQRPGSPGAEFEQLLPALFGGLFDRDGQDGKEGDICVQVLTPISYILARFNLLESARVKEVKHRLFELRGAFVLRQRLQCKLTRRDLNDNDLVQDLPEPRTITFYDLPYRQEQSELLVRDVQQGDAQPVEGLLHRQADPNYASTTTLPPLHLAARLGHCKIMYLLHLAGADKERRSEAGEGPLLLAAAAGHVRAIRWLHAASADCNSVASLSNATPLSVASSKGLLPVVRILREVGADINKAGSSGGSPLYHAAKSGHVEVVRFLCGVGADKERALAAGTTPLLAAAGIGHVHVVHELCAAKADKEQEANGFTPLCLAAAEGNLEVVQELCAAGADRERACVDGTTALAAAQRSARWHVVQFLSC